MHSDMNTIEEITYRKMSSDDIKDIYELVYELAIFEKEPDAMVAKIADYYTAFESGLIDGSVAVSNEEVIGMTVYYMTFSTWKGNCLYLEDFYVKDAYRKFGIGQVLFDAYISDAKSKNCAMCKWQVLDWNSVGLNFYDKNNAIIEKNWWNGKIFF